MYRLVWHGDPLDCQYCKNAKFPHDHAHDRIVVRRRNKNLIKRVQAPPRTIQATLEFGEDTIDCE